MIGKVFVTILPFILAALFYELLIVIEGMERGPDTIVVLAIGVGILMLILIVLITIISLIEFLNK